MFFTPQAIHSFTPTPQATSFLSSSFFLRMDNPYLTRKRIGDFIFSLYPYYKGALCGQRTRISVHRNSDFSFLFFVYYVREGGHTEEAKLSRIWKRMRYLRKKIFVIEGYVISSCSCAGYDAGRGNYGR